MEHKKYAPLIGKVLTWEMLEGIVNDARAQAKVEIRAALKKRKQKAEGSSHTEHDGA